jgi:hypothetical protein
MKVTVAHLRSVPGFSEKPGFCLPKSRVWARRHGLDWRDFIRNGIDIEMLESINDAFAQALVAHARREVANGR